MIDLRYHIVSIMAVFLALGMGILLGSSVVSSRLEGRLTDDVARYKSERDQAEAERSELDELNAQLSKRLGSEVAPWAMQNRLEDVSIVLFVDDAAAPDWREHVLDALVASGAKTQGTIGLGRKWGLSTTADRTDLLRTVQSVVPAFAPGTEELRAAVLSVLGERFGDEVGRALIDALAEEGFLAVQGPRDEPWPDPASTIVVLSPSREEETSLGAGGIGFAIEVSEVLPTLVATDTLEGHSIVTQLRDRGGLSDRLATFDSATNDGDPGGVGVAAAMLAALEGRGGHYGAARGLAFVAPPGPDE